MSDANDKGITDWRGRIDEIDRKLVELFNERLKCAIEIGKLKKRDSLDVLDAERERQVLRNIQTENHGPLNNEDLQRIFEHLIDLCKQIEYRILDKD